MEIHIDNQQALVEIDIQRYRSRIKRILNALASDPLELSVVFVDDPAIAQLNSQYLDRSGPTNVIAFPMQEGAFTGVQPQLLGDVVISTETAYREAHEYGQTVEARIDFLLIHGILHLFGFDHVHDEAQAEIMEAKAKELEELIRSQPIG